MATNKLVTSSILQYYDNKLKAWVAQEINSGVSELGQVLRLCGRVDDTTKLPAEATAGDVYLVGAEGSESFEEYYYYGDKWEYMGVTRVSLDGYVTEAMLYAGADGTGTSSAPAEGTLLAPIVASVKANATAIEAINNADTGVLAQAKAYTDEKDTAMGERVTAVETAVSDLATEADIDSLFTGSVG